MISKSKLAALALIATTIGFAAPAFAQVPPGYYSEYAAPPYAYPYQPVPYGWASYGGWPPGSPAAMDYNIHTPPNH
jgi:hypothetical protein